LFGLPSVADKFIAIAMSRNHKSCSRNVCIYFYACIRKHRSSL